jgi:predicted DNA-binding transcriptional regulator AlpA
MSRLAAHAVLNRAVSAPQTPAVGQCPPGSAPNPSADTRVGSGQDNPGSGSGGANTGGYTLIDVEGVAKKLGVSRASVYRAKEKDGLPDSVTIGERSVRWISEEIDAWLAAHCPPLKIWRKIRHRFGFGIPGEAA